MTKINFLCTSMFQVRILFSFILYSSQTERGERKKFSKREVSIREELTKITLTGIYKCLHSYIRIYAFIYSCTKLIVFI